MNPTAQGQLRTALAGLGAMLVTLGWATPEIVEALAGHIVAVASPIVGFVIFALPFYLSWRAKQPTSKEAQAIADKVDFAKSDWRI